MKTISISLQTISKFDLDMFRIIGLEQINVDVYYSSVDLNATPHWLYGFCNNNSDTKNIGYLITSEAYGHCACIRKYFNASDSGK